MSAFYSNSIADFLLQSENEIFAKLTTVHLNNFSELTKKQEKSWKKFLMILRIVFSLKEIQLLLPDNSAILFEYKIPRREKRIDCVLIIGELILVIEFKFWSEGSNNSGKTQVEDYCLDLRDFHKESRTRKIIPLLLSPKTKIVTDDFTITDEAMQNVIFCNEENFSSILLKAATLAGSKDKFIDYKKWDKSEYSPTPTIIEAVKRLYKGQSVDEITRHHAGIENLNETTEVVVKAIRDAQAKNQKIICFITGVPGAGKTLAGLNIAHLEEFQFADYSLATFLSGNVPLINVLREALKRDVLRKFKRGEVALKKKEVERISTFIEKVHTFIDTYYHQKDIIPNNKILIFDEAQRAWNEEHKVRKSEGNYDKSEPHILFEIMERHKDWCAIIALIGGGQEINTGESGLEEWGKALNKKFTNWKVYVSPSLIGANSYYAHKPLFKETSSNINVTPIKELHLSVVIRSYNAEKLSDWVSNVLELNPKEAKEIFDKHLTGFPIFLTRDLQRCKSFLKTKALGTRRVGLVASSGGRRLRAYGLDVDIILRETMWFLNDPEDIRSSNFMELVGKDFKIQGLELDWTGICWDADFHICNNEWVYQSFGGTNWRPVNKQTQRDFIKNKYRVLLTRAREGMVIWVPKGIESDKSMPFYFYDGTFEFLKSCGLKEI